MTPKGLTGMETGFADRLSEVFVEVADTLVEDFDLIEFLQRVTSHTADLFDARAAGLMLSDHRGRLHLMAASDERAHSLAIERTVRFATVAFGNSASGSYR